MSSKTKVAKENRLEIIFTNSRASIGPRNKQFAELCQNIANDDTKWIEWEKMYLETKNKPGKIYIDPSYKMMFVKSGGITEIMNICGGGVIF